MAKKLISLCVITLLMSVFAFGYGLVNSGTTTENLDPNPLRFQHCLCENDEVSEVFLIRERIREMNQLKLQEMKQINKTGAFEVSENQTNQNQKEVQQRSQYRNQTADNIMTNTQLPDQTQKRDQVRSQDRDCTPVCDQTNDQTCDQTQRRDQVRSQDCDFTPVCDQTCDQIREREQAMDQDCSQNGILPHNCFMNQNELQPEDPDVQQTQTKIQTQSTTMTGSHFQSRNGK